MLARGIDDTSMPAFGLLPEYELEYLASYVIHLSIRGRIRDVWRDCFKKARTTNTPSTSGDIGTVVYVTASILITGHAPIPNRSSQATIPSTTAKKRRRASIRKGHQLFIGKAGCISCHNDYGRQVYYRYDLWGTLVRPANLTAGVYRGGRRPLDLYYRITRRHQAGRDDLGEQPVSDRIWDVVNFIRTPLSGHVARRGRYGVGPARAVADGGHKLTGSQRSLRGKGLEHFVRRGDVAPSQLVRRRPSVGWWMPENSPPRSAVISITSSTSSSASRASSSS